MLYTSADLAQCIDAYMCALSCLQLSLADPCLSEAEINSIQTTVEGKRAHVQDLRQQRLVLVTARGAAAAELRKAEVVLRDAHHARLQQRQLLLEHQTMQVGVGL
jgi:hypothetical protein